MNRATKVVVLAVIAVLGFDTLGSVAALITGFPYTSLFIGSFLIYLSTGFLGPVDIVSAAI